jgi:hypothetical protein
MIEHVDRLLDEHASPKHCCTFKAHAAITPISRFVADVKMQLAEYEHLVNELENADPTGEHMLKGHTEHLHQTVGNAKLEVDALALHARNLAKAFRQLSENMRDVTAEVKAKLEAASAAE